MFLSNRLQYNNAYKWQKENVRRKKETESNEFSNTIT